VRLVADANVLLSAGIGGQARAVLEHPAVESVVTAAFTFEEVQEYASYLAQKKRLDPQRLPLRGLARCLALSIDTQASSKVPRRCGRSGGVSRGVVFPVLAAEEPAFRQFC
jgi:predicted nucleic acid-binding protein